MSKKRTEADYHEQIDILRDLADGMTCGPAKTSLLEQCVRIADTHNDEAAATICVSNSCRLPPSADKLNSTSAHL